MEVLSSAIVIACVVNMLMIFPYYQYLKRYGKPFNCAYCMSFWCALAIGLFGLHDLTTLQWLLVTLASPFVGEGLNRAFSALPIRL